MHAINHEQQFSSLQNKKGNSFFNMWLNITLSIVHEHFLRSTDHHGLGIHCQVVQENILSHDSMSINIISKSYERSSPLIISPAALPPKLVAMVIVGHKRCIINIDITERIIRAYEIKESNWRCNHQPLSFH